MKRVIAFLAASALLGISVASSAAPTPQTLLQMLDYVGVDYSEAVAGGSVINEGEYREMLDFAAAIDEGVAALDENTAKPALAAQARALMAAVEGKASPAEVSAMVGEMRKRFLANFEFAATPRRAPDFEHAKTLYQENCASCHGADGAGNGPAAAGLEPAPTDFTDYERHAQRTLFGLFNTITLGVDETAMAGFESLSADERWDLAFYVGKMAVPVNRVAAGETIWGERGPSAPLDLGQLTTATPNEIEAGQGAEGLELMSFLRARPQVLFSSKPAPLKFAREGLEQSLAAYRAGDAEKAYSLAVTAYLEGFELTEAALDAVAPELRREVERVMTAYRNDVRLGVPVAEAETKALQVFELLGQAEQRLERTELSTASAFTGSFLILLREGLEAILVVAALFAFLLKTGRRDAMPYLHAGWIAALAAGGFTWVLSTYVVEIGGAGRELTEAVAAIVAAGVLFYVGFWLHSKTQAGRWQRFIEQSVNRALNAPTLWSLAGLSFITVYREAFETILFYQALWVQSGSEAKGMVLTGFVSAAVILMGLAWTIIRYSARLPLRQFFSVTGVFMFVLAVVFAGKGIAALQEAGKLSATPVNFPVIELLGVYPNAQGLALQVGMVILALLLLFRERRRLV